MNNDVYVWGSYAVTFALLAIEIVLLRRRWRRLSR
jgi:heme exporter protein CcmD